MKKIKDPISGFSHLAGAIASIVGLVFLIIYAAKYGEGAWDVVSFTIFGSGLVLLYTASSVYHLGNVSPKATKVLRKLDHIKWHQWCRKFRLLVATKESLERLVY